MEGVLGGAPTAGAHGRGAKVLRRAARSPSSGRSPGLFSRRSAERRTCERWRRARERASGSLSPIRRSSTSRRSRAAGIGGVMRLPGGVVHLVLGEEAEALAAALRDALRGAGE